MSIFSDGPTDPFGYGASRAAPRTATRPPVPRSSRRGLERAVLALSLTLSACAPVQMSASTLSVAEILTNPARFSGSFVSLVGRATSIAPHVSAEGLPTSTFFLDDGTGVIPVVAPGPPACPGGQTIMVEGVFRGQEPAARSVRPSRVEATAVRCP